jgi:hypothetical protein
MRTAVLLLFAVFALASCQTANPVKASSALTQPLIIPIRHEGCDRYQVIREWEWEWRGRREKAPLGLVVDGASVPRPAWWFMPPDGLHRAAALGHDLAYIGRGMMPSGNWMSRAEADTMFYDLMISGGVNKNRARIAWAGVRVGGWVEWSKPYRGPVIMPVQQPFASRRRAQFLLGRHIYQ